MRHKFYCRKTACFNNASRFTMKLTGTLYEATAKLVKVVLNLLFTVPVYIMFPSKNFDQLQ